MRLAWIPLSLLFLSHANASSIYSRESYEQDRRITVTSELDSDGQPTGILLVTYEKIREDKKTHAVTVKSSTALGRISKIDLQKWVDYETRKNIELSKNAGAKPDPEAAVLAVGSAQQYGLGAQAGLRYVLQSFFSQSAPSYEQTAYALKFASEYSSNNPAFDKTYPDVGVYFSDFKKQVITILNTPPPIFSVPTTNPAISELEVKAEKLGAPIAPSVKADQNSTNSAP